MCQTQAVTLNFPLLQTYITLKFTLLQSYIFTEIHIVTDPHKLLRHKARCVFR
jgi:hypothetical protein